MNNVSKTTLSCLIIGLLLSLSHITAIAEQGKIRLEFKDQNLSADIEETPLKAIIEKIKKQKGIWFKGKESLLTEKVSVRFKDLPIQDGLKQILSTLNYSLIFDKQNSLIGVIVLEKSKGVKKRGKVKTVAPPKPVPEKPVPEKPAPKIVPKKEIKPPPPPK